VLLILLLAVGAGGLATPRIPSSSTDVTDFSAERAIRHVASVAQEPHPIGSSASDDVRRYLVDQLAAFGLKPTLQKSEAPDSCVISDGPVKGVNVIARIPVTKSTSRVVLMAHYDSVPTRLTRLVCEVCGTMDPTRSPPPGLLGIWT
jgi:acetylornithine deacetylase/succinyl-diaminopimelate desuccinylase-like protein